MSTVWRPALSLLALMTLLTGIAYPLVVTGVAQAVFPDQANGSLLIDADGKVRGSSLIAQDFTGDAWFHPRPSAGAFATVSSSASNLAPSNPALADAVKQRIAALRAADPGNDAPVPVDLVTASASGLDPEISPAAATFQANRVARARQIPADTVRRLIAENTQGRQFGVLGEPRVNVLALNLALDAATR